MIGLRPHDMMPVPIGASLQECYELQIATLQEPIDGLVYCILNGEYISRLTEEQFEHVRSIRESGAEDALTQSNAQWREYGLRADNWRLILTEPEDVVEWHIHPQGRETIRTLLQVAIIIAAIWFQPALPYLAAINAAYNILLPPLQPKINNGEPAGSIYQAALTGNEARLDQVIWKNAGRVKITPPFAAQPYIEFRPSDPTNALVDNDMYFFALFAVGIGDHILEKAFIGKTPISHYQDVVVANYLPPGTQPSQVLANVISSTEIDNLELTDRIYVGAYAASRPGDKVHAIGIDVAAPQGLGVFGTSFHAVTATWQVEVREIDDFGTPAGDWIIVANESRSQSTNTPQRWSNKYVLSTPIRCEVRIARTDTKNQDADARDGIVWIGLRAYLEKPAPLNPNCAYYEVVVRASEQLSVGSQHDFSMIVRAKCRQWNPDTGFQWYDPAIGLNTNTIFTRNAAWWLLELWTSPIWGEGLPIDRIDMVGLYEWSLTLDARQDHFDFCFSTARDSWEAAQLIARSGRARVFRRNGVYTVARDELVDLPITAFTHRMCDPGSMVMHERLPTRDSPDGMVVEYQSNVTWDTADIECPCPGFSVSNSDDPRFDPDLPPMTRPVYITLDGITGSKHAEREGLYQAANAALRTRTTSCKIEMQGTIVAFMDPIRWQPLIRGYGQSGDVVDRSPLSDPIVRLTLSEPAIFGDEPVYLTLQRDDGSLTIPAQVLPGPYENDVLLPAEPDFILTLDDGRRERPRYILGPLGTSDELVKISSIGDGGKSDKGAQLFDIEAVVDDDRVHEADNHLLPVDGEIQDPIDNGIDNSSDDGPGGGGGPGNFINLSAHNFIALCAFTTATIKFRVLQNGSFDGYDNDVANDGTPAYQGNGHHVFNNEWLTNWPAEPTTAALYECYLEDVYGTTAAFIAANPDLVSFSGPAFNTWVPITADRIWEWDVQPTTNGAASMRLKFRRAGTTTILADQPIGIQFEGLLDH